MNIDIKPDVYKALVDIANKKDMSVHKMIRSILVNYSRDEGETNNEYQHK